MAAVRRLQKELTELKESGLNQIIDIQVDDNNILFWSLTLLPNVKPYDKGAFKISITFPPEYPFKPPRIQFRTKIYHPNIDETGNICLPIISPEHWKPPTRIDQVMQALVALVSDPDPHFPLRSDIAEEMINDKRRFLQNAEEFTARHAEKRPPPVESEVP